MKIFLILLFMINTLFAFELEKLKSTKQIKENQDTLIMFSTNYCPWCARQRTQLEQISVVQDNIQIFEVKDNDIIYKKLIKKYPFTIRFYPTTFIVEKENNDLFIKYEFQGYQNREKILSVLKEENSF